MPVPLATIEAQSSAAERACRPIDGRELVVKVEQTLRLFKLPEDWDEVAGFYLEALEDVPADLVDKALKDLRLRHKWRTSFPTPADLRVSIAEDLGRRHAVRRRLQVAAMIARRSPPPSAPVERKPLTPDQVERIEAAKRALRAARPVTAETGPVPSERRVRRGNPVPGVLAEAKSFRLVDESDERVAKIMGAMG